MVLMSQMVKGQNLDTLMIEIPLAPGTFFMTKIDRDDTALKKLHWISMDTNGVKPISYLKYIKESGQKYDQGLDITQHQYFEIEAIYSRYAEYDAIIKSFNPKNKISENLWIYDPKGNPKYLISVFKDSKNKKLFYVFELVSN